MLTLDKKKVLWQKVTKEFPSDPMLRDLYFIRKLMTTLKRKVGEPKSYRELSLMAGEEFIEWLKVHPELSEE